MTTAIFQNNKLLFVLLCTLLFSCTKEKFVTTQVISPKEVEFPTNIPDFALGTYKIVEFDYSIFYPDICQYGNDITVDSAHYRYHFTIKPNGIVEMWKKDSLQHKTIITKIIDYTNYHQLNLYLNNNMRTCVIIDYGEGEKPKVGDIMSNANTLFDYYTYDIQRLLGFSARYVKTK